MNKKPFLKTDFHTWQSNNPNKQETHYKMNKSHQKNNSNKKINLKQSLIIQKLKKQTEQLKQIKKTISCISHSRLSQMKRLQPDKINENDSMNVYRISQPNSLKASEYKLANNYKTLRQLRFHKNLKDNENIQQFDNKNEKISVFGVQNEQKVEQKDDIKQLDQQYDRIKLINKKVNKLITKQQLKQISSNKQDKQQQRQDKQQQKQQKQQQKQDKYQQQDDQQKTKEYKKGYKVNQIKIKQNNNFFSLNNNNRLQISDEYQLADEQLKNSLSSRTSKNMKDRYEQKLRQSKQRIMNNKIRMGESQTNFKLQKRIKQNIQLIQKQNTIKQMIMNRMQRQRQRFEKNKRKNEQKRLVHDSNNMKVNIIRENKRLNIKIQRQILRSKSDNSLLQMTFKRFSKQVEDVKKQQLFTYNIQFLKGVRIPNIITGSKLSVNPQYNHINYCHQQQ